MSTQLDGDFLVLPTVAQPKVMVRDCYKTLARLVRTEWGNKHNRVLLLGTPGTGKSVFREYMLWDLVHNDLPSSATVLIGKCDTDADAHFAFHDGAQWTSVSRNSLPTATHNILICDSWDPTARFLNDILSGISWKSLMVSSPDANRYNEFQKTAFKVYMPLWTEAELAKLATTYSGIQWKERYKILGGVPRLIFENPSEATDLVKAALSGQNLMTALQTVRNVCISPALLMSSRTRMLLEPRPRFIQVASCSGPLHLHCAIIVRSLHRPL